MILYYTIDMGRTIISEDGRYEWDEEKNRKNRKKHGFSFEEILEVFDDPAFLEGYNYEHSTNEERYYGIGCFNNALYIIVFYTYRRRKLDAGLYVSEAEPHYNERKRLISARRADTEEQEEYNDYFKKIKS
jgi:uncharacterized DUF497 family protein